ncbi:hypothetical protein AZH53_00590 [Methanomicrobiaceae archaeon CYW5]|uniref:mechanosensitive ion channel family protein n=1 Tax=Methanovulcanius yangii TaxID=1789227 RepID=UPI0029CA274F|nr:hypothetical protein [Methanovulcanius yangii]MBT8506927.1 hypothetical protein [Methanovulcanius yangii]
MAITDVAVQTVGSIGDALMQALYSVIAFLPNIIAAVIILIIGWIIGRVLGSVISKVLDKIGVDDALRKTSLGKAIEDSGTNIVHLFDLIVRWFVYLIAILAAIDVLQFAFLSDLFQDFILYLPRIVMFLIILIAGFILVDYFADLIQGWGKTREIEFFGAIVLLLRVFFYFVVLILALSQLLIDLTIIYTFLVPIAWGVGLGIGVGIAAFFAYGLKDRAPELMDRMLEKFEK